MATYQFQGQDIVAPFKITSNEPMFSADSVSLKHRRISTGAQRWELEFGVVMQDASSTFADMVSTFDDAITMTMPQLNVRGEIISSGTSTASILVSAQANANSSTVALSGANGTIAKGRFIKFNNHDKIYIVTSEYSGTGSLSIYPSLRANVPALSSLQYRDSDPIILTAFRDITNINGITYTDGILSEAGNINLIEAL